MQNIDVDLPGARRAGLPASAGPLLAAGVLIAAAVATGLALRVVPTWRSERSARASVAAVAANERRSGGASDPADRVGDDLSVIEGIGPRLESVLKAAGITTYQKLAETRPGRLETIMREAHTRMANPSTWPEQAALAADGRWQELRDLQRDLKSGKRVH